VATGFNALQVGKAWLWVMLGKCVNPGTGTVSGFAHATGTDIFPNPYYLVPKCCVQWGACGGPLVSFSKSAP
jgi:hypothetical protein